jgi:hypothetical protein
VGGGVGSIAPRFGITETGEFLVNGQLDRLIERLIDRRTSGVEGNRDQTRQRQRDRMVSIALALGVRRLKTL